MDTPLPLDSIATCWMCGASLASACVYGRIALAGQSRKETFHTESKPSVTGTFSSNGAVAKCSSMFHAPSRNFSIVSKPYWSDSGSMPTAEHTEYRPPTQSQNANALSGSMPNSPTSLRLVDTATMCFLTASWPRAAMIHWRTVLALSIVSAVVNVLDTTTTSVVSGSRPLSERATSTGSTLARKRSCLPLAPSAASPQVRSAVCTKSGPRKEPPMPMATTEVSGLPVCPSHSPLRTFSVKSLILSRTSQTSGTTFLPSTLITLLRGARVATWSTARSSVELMCSPENMALILPLRFASSASS
mmetsp:Transcript_2908/g.11465  ORF Transcript_2908/g.11465 Transcript_2908/m.11465 type:complete len:303 (-) Transcript_2908:510-1418(-)